MGLSIQQSKDRVALHYALHSVRNAGDESCLLTSRAQADSAMHLEHILQFLNLVHTLLCGPPGTMACQPVSENRLRFMWSKVGVKVCKTSSVFIWSLRQQAQLRLMKTSVLRGACKDSPWWKDAFDTQKGAEALNLQGSEPKPYVSRPRVVRAFESVGCSGSCCCYRHGCDQQISHRAAQSNQG